MMADSSGELDLALLRLHNAPYDESAWGTVYTVLWPYVYAVAFRRLDGSADLAQDATQEVFLRLLRAGPATSFQNSAALRAYLHVAAHRVVIDYIRYQTKHCAVQLTDSMEDIPHSADVEEDLAVQQTLNIFLRQLGDSDQQLIRQLVYGLSIGEIAVELNISPGAARVRLHRLRRRLSGLHTDQTDSRISPGM
jgi:RNA polymerase sigma factor (sigma-70 family)